MSDDSSYWSYFVIAWLIIGHTYGIIKIYSFGFGRNNTKTEVEIEENETIYRYVRILNPFLRNPAPDASSGIEYYRSVRRYFFIFLIICQTVATIGIAIVIKMKV